MDVTTVEAGPVTLQIDMEDLLVVLTLISSTGGEIVLPLTAQEATTLGKALLSRGILSA